MVFTQQAAPQWLHFQACHGLIWAVFWEMLLMV